MAALVLGVSTLAALPACSTTYDSTLVTDPSSTTTTSTIPVGSATELLPQLAEQAQALSGMMLAGDDANSAAQRIQEIWDVVKVEVNRARPDLTSDFSRNVGRCATAVKFKRAADADKAGRNLRELVDAYLA